MLLVVTTSGKAGVAAQSQYGTRKVLAAAI
jgi:hypothetical protein